MAKLFDEDIMECLLEIFDNLRFKHKAAGSSKPTADDQPTDLPTREAIVADIYISESGDRDFLVDREAPSTSTSHLENNPPSTPHRGTLVEPPYAGNSDGGSAEDLIPQTEVNNVKEEKIP